jgi:gamma-glutamylcyclotransferase (GGCT)/AIG2-like uncharacterized protein YtfP
MQTVTTISTYFAYGSNLHADHVRDHFGARAVLRHPGRPAWLVDHRVGFAIRSERWGGGALDVVPSFGSAVPGALFEVEADALAALDAKESVPGRYERLQHWIVAADGAAIRAWAYTVAKNVRIAHAPPSSRYLETVLGGLEAHRLPTHAHRAASAGEDAPFPAFLFVYGTLRRGEARHALLDGMRFSGTGTIDAALVDLGEYPGLVPGEGRVAGELFAIDDPSCLRRIDEYEGFHGFDDASSLYHRGVCRVATASGTAVHAFTYFYRGDLTGARQLSGDWCRR